jgi:2-dehydro-3-deoxyphosphooctonate aldolase (KDO 8-P synthase)
MVYLNKVMKIFAGPCLLESEEMCFEVAETISKYIPDGVDYYFKASFSKANRSSHNSFTGHGYDFAINVFEKLRKSGYKVITDVHDVVDVSLFSNYVDAFQIPAFLCRQNNLLQAVAESGKLVNVKKGQFLSPRQAILLGEKMEAYGCKDFYICERGTSFGYDNLVVDFRTIHKLKSAGFKTCFDATHSTQEGGENTTSGNWLYAQPLAQSAKIWGAEAFFFETHPSPKDALSDKDCQIPLTMFPSVLDSIL